MPSKLKKRGDNSYLISVKHQQKEYTKTVHAESKSEAERLWKLFAAEVIQGKAISGDTQKMTLLQFYDYFKKHHMEKNNSPATIQYNQNLFQRIGSSLGHLKIDKIAPRHVLEFIDQISAPDVSIAGKPLSSRSIRGHFDMLNKMFNYALKWDLIISNPCERCEKPRMSKSKKQILDETTLSLFLEKLLDYPLKNRLWCFLAFSRGLRREEIFGLQWSDIDFQKKTITIDRAAVYIPKNGIDIKSCKTDNSHRVLSIPPDILQMIMDWQEELLQINQRRQQRQKVVEVNNDLLWVFPQANGSVGHPHSFNTFLRRFCSDNNLPTVHPHLLRHMMGSYLLNSGANIASVSKDLGHGHKAFTMNTYIHSLESAELENANTMQGILENLKKRPSQQTKK